jgi:hypothetical protein
MYSTCHYIEKREAMKPKGINRIAVIGYGYEAEVP